MEQLREYKRMYNLLIGIFPDDAIEFANKYNNLCSDILTETSNELEYSIIKPKLERQITLQNNDCWTLAKIAYLYKSYGETCASNNLTKQSISSFNRYSQYKEVAIYKYGEEEFESNYQYIVNNENGPHQVSITINNDNKAAHDFTDADHDLADADHDMIAIDILEDTYICQEHKKHDNEIIMSPYRGHCNKCNKKRSVNGYSNPNHVSNPFGYLYLFPEICDSCAKKYKCCRWCI